MRQSVQELFEKYQDSLYVLSFNICKSAEDAKDVVQDTFMQYYTLKKENNTHCVCSNHICSVVTRLIVQALLLGKKQKMSPRLT